MNDNAYYWLITGRRWNGAAVEHSSYYVKSYKKMTKDLIESIEIFINRDLESFSLIDDEFEEYNIFIDVDGNVEWADE